jgi:hypothetical protein
MLGPNASFAARDPAPDPPGSARVFNIVSTVFRPTAKARPNPQKGIITLWAVMFGRKTSCFLWRSELQ